MSNTKIFKNTFYLLTRTIVVLIISLFTIRELLSVLGADSYGLFNLIFGIAVLFTFINGALTVSVQRYLAVRIGENDNNGLRDVFLTSCIINIGMGLLIALMMLVFKNIIIYKLLKVANSFYIAESLYTLAIFNTFIIFLQTPLIALINIYEKMKILAYAGVVDVFLKLFSVYILSTLSGSVVINYGFFFTLITFFIFIFYLFYCFFEFRQLFILRSFRLKSFKENLYSISGFMGWTLIGNFSWMSKNQGINILLNMFFGLVANAAYAIYNNVFNSINNLLNSVTNAIKPQIFISYSINDISRFNNLILYGTKFFTLGVVVFVAPIIIFSNEILLFWLRNPPQYAIDFVSLGMLVLIIESLSIFLTIGVQAVGKIKVYQIVLGTILLSNIPIIFLLFKLNFPINSYMYVLMINALICFFSRLYFLRKYVFFDVFNFIKICVLRLLVLLLISLFLNKIIYEFLLYQKFNSLTYVLIMPFLILINLILVYFFCLDRKDRMDINAIISKVLARN